MAEYDVLTLNTDDGRAEVPQTGNTGRVPKRLNLAEGFIASGVTEYGTPGPFTSDISVKRLDTSLDVNGIEEFTQHNADDARGVVDVYDNRGILHHGSNYEVNTRVRIADAAYVDIIGRRTLVTRDFKDGTDIGNANVFLTGHIAFVQQDSEVGARSEQAIGETVFTKIENGTAGTVMGINFGAQLGTSSGRDVTIDKVVAAIGSTSYMIGRAGGNSTITDFFQIELPTPTIQGTVNFTNIWGIWQDWDQARNRFAGETTFENFLHLKERSADPPDPAEGHTTVWMSDGTGSGDDGDIMMKITAGGVTKTVTLVDFSAS